MYVEKYKDAVRYMSVPMNLNMISDEYCKQLEYDKFVYAVDEMFAWLKSDSFRLWQFTMQLAYEKVYQLEGDDIDRLHDIDTDHALHKYAVVLLSMLGDELDPMEYLEFYLLQAMFVFYFHEPKEKVIR